MATLKEEVRHLNGKRGKIFSLNTSKEKGTAKHPITQAYLIEGKGVNHDAHSGTHPNRQVSLLSWEAIQKQTPHQKTNKRFKGFKPGDFAENITTKGIDLSSLKIGDKLTINNSVILEISQIGKVCHDYCEIFKKVGSCIMPKQGIFSKVTKGGKISVNDPIILSAP